MCYPKTWTVIPGLLFFNLQGFREAVRFGLPKYWLETKIMILRSFALKDHHFLSSNSFHRTQYAKAKASHLQVFLSEERLVSLP